MATSRPVCKLSRRKHLSCLEKQIYTSRKSLRPLRLELGTLLTVCRPEDSEIEVANMKPGVGKTESFPSIWGHWAGGPGDSKEDVKWLNEKLQEIGL